MKIELKAIKSGLVGLMMMWATAPAFGAQGLSTFAGSLVWLEGDSSLHAFTSTSTAVAVQGAWEGPTADLKEVISEGRVKDFEFSIPVVTLKSGKSALDKNMYRAMNAVEFSSITFKMSGYRPERSAAGELSIKASGTLTIAGQSRAVELVAQAKPLKEGVRVTGAHELLMTDFGIKPPKMMGGMIKTKDKIVVHFDLVLGLENAQTERRMK